MQQGVSRVFLGIFSILFGLFQTGCGTKYSSALPLSSDLGSPRGYRIVRTILHMHSPYSYDACDNKGLSGGKPNADCLDHLKIALCENRIDFVFLTDHPAEMQSYEAQDLLLKEGTDQITLKNGAPYSNQISKCGSTISPTILYGFESRLMAMGMTKHLETDIQARGTLYSQETVELRNRLKSEADAVVIIPHTESRTLDKIRTVNPDGIEIYNFHANLDPKIRKTDIGVAPFTTIPSVITYLLDPYGELKPDFAFLHFLELYSNPFQKWNQLVTNGNKVTGIGATDSHENIFPQKVADGERFDSHRRIMRMMSNHFLVSSVDADSVKDAIKAGRGWVVFEGLGSPVGMDFYAKIGESTTVGVGETGSLGGKTATITVSSPSLSTLTSQGKEKPVIKLKLKKINTDGTEQTVASAEGSSIQFQTQDAGAYRAEITIIPKHLKDFLGTFSSQGEREYPWIITNHLYLTS